MAFIARLKELVVSLLSEPAPEIPAQDRGIHREQLLEDVLG
ncbi:hypothetical protein SAMN05421504_107139 [Amycolatopsis xylanica]|uniref:Uncharacterized protein n=1 Tax=Amycolatopsis xylanica TaxID=589385 RepID=A0A1H3N575_9PSEU|nr:hypothetical protein [Amycolatopsis xylanica]SDY84032.1 hypothetical protein SAMN05421504_107139 [Amycolatopsis xylanica]